MKIDVKIGEKQVYLELGGIDLKQQRNILHTIMAGIFADLDKEIDGETCGEVSENVEIEEEIEIHETVAAEPVGDKESVEDIKPEEDFAELITDPRMTTHFPIADLLKNYGEVYDGEPIPYDSFPSELKRAIDNGLNEYNYKIDPTSGSPLYQSYYICTGCGNKGKHFIPVGRKSLTCHACKKRMLTRTALDQEFPHNDSYGNMFIAGDFLRPGERKTLADKEKERNRYMV